MKIPIILSKNPSSEHHLCRDLKKTTEETGGSPCMSQVRSTSSLAQSILILQSNLNFRICEERKIDKIVVEE